MQAIIKQGDEQRPGGRAPARNGASTPLEEQGLSPYLCPWCRNGLSLNEAHEICLAQGRFSRFWPVDDASLSGDPAVPVREIALGQLSPAERHMLAWFYLYLVVKAIQETGVKT